MFNNRRVTFVEELPDIDETSIIENYEHSNQKQPSGPPPPLPTKSNNSAYSSYGNVYGGNEQPKRPPSGPPMPTTMGGGGNFKDESREKDLLLQRATQKLPSRQGRIIAPDEEYDDRRYEYPRDENHHSHAHPYIIYEESPTSLPKYTVSRPPSRLRPVQPQPPPPSYPMYPPPHSPPPVYPHQPIYNPQGPPPHNMMPPDQVASVCNMINKHLSTCALCSKLYTSNIKHQQKLGAACGTGLRKNMNVVIYIIIILLLIITCVVLFRKLYNKTNIV